jgi:hypothetical protein
MPCCDEFPQGFAGWMMIQAMRAGRGYRSPLLTFL